MFAPMPFTHRPSWPDYRPKEDRAVYHNGDRVGRIYKDKHGPMRGRWRAFAQWGGVGPDLGDYLSLEDALGVVKDLYLKTELSGI
jgi:hypothetical protein